MKMKDMETEDLLKYFSIGSGSILFVIGILLSMIAPTFGVLFFVFALVLGLIPLSIYRYFQYSRFKKMEEHFPTFMRDLAEAKKSGMTFPQALEMASRGEYGALTVELKRAANQLSWGIPFPKVIARMSNRIKGSKIMKQAFTIIIEAYNSGGDIAETMDSIAMDIGTVRSVEQEKKAVMTQQIFIMYFIFFLFLGIVVALYKLLIPMMTMQETAGGGIAGLGSFGLGATNYCLTVPWLCTMGEAFGFGTGPLTYFKTLFLCMALIQGIACGVIAGEIGEGSIVAGVKHIGMMVISALIIFFIFIR